MKLVVMAGVWCSRRRCILLKDQLQIWRGLPCFIASLDVQRLSQRCTSVMYNETQIHEYALCVRKARRSDPPFNATNSKGKFLRARAAFLDIRERERERESAVRGTCPCTSQCEVSLLL